MKKSIAALTFSLALTSTAQGQETYYVNDILTITLRTGESTSNQIIRTLKSGTKLTILETHEDTGYSRAILADGTEGWVLTRFLSKDPVARDQLKQAKRTITQLEKQLKQTKAELNSLSETQQDTSASATKLGKEKEKLTQELNRIKELSANSIALDEENRSMKAENIRLETEIQSLEQQKAVLQDRNDRDWFISGAGVTVLGLIIGLLIPKIRLKKKASWSEL